MKVGNSRFPFVEGYRGIERIASTANEYPFAINACWEYPKPLITKGGDSMDNRKRNIQMKFYVTEEEKRLIDEKMKQLPIRQYGAYFRKMAIDGYILVVDRSDTKEYIRQLQAVSRNINQIAKRANATGAVYEQDIADIKKAVYEIWQLQRRTLLNQP